METGPLVEVPCTVCGGREHVEVLSARQVRAQLRYLRLFHRRRLRPGPDGRVPAAALAERADITQDYATAIVACRACGLVFRNPRPRARRILAAYAHDHYGRQRLRALFESQRALYRPRARRLRRWLGRGRVRCIEVGSFVGGFLAAGRELGWEMQGVDLGEEVDAFCQAHGLPVFRGTLAELPAAPGSADCVAIWNTFDQLPDPRPTLAAARRLLRTGGVLALRVPSGACFRALMAWHRRLPRAAAGCLRAVLAWNNLLAFPYLAGYSPGTLDRLLRPQGLVRLAVDADSLPRLSDERTRTWAAWEERLLKLAGDAAVRPLGPLQVEDAGPWLDVYYRAL